VGEIPHEKALVERLKDSPFALIGVNTDGDKEEYKRKLGEYGVTWRSAWQGGLDGPIPTQWGVNSYPTIFVLDAQHVIRYLDSRGEDLGRAVDVLLAESPAKAKESAKGR
jgi:hypothetical protein